MSLALLKIWAMLIIFSLCGILSVLQRVRESLLARDEEVRQEVLFPIVLRLRISTQLDISLFLSVS